MRKRLTREERRQRSQRRLQLLTYLCFVLLLLAWLASYLVMTVEAEPAETAAKPPESAQGASLPGDDTPALVRCYLTEEEREEAENELIEAALLARSHKLEDVTVTHYCTCAKCCGKSDGITASGRMATPGVSVAVDPSIIPLGSTVMADYGDGVLHYYRADDTGGGVKGAHIDLCVDSHEAAIKAGVRSATIFWCEEGEQ